MNTLNATSETLAVHGGADRLSPPPVGPKLFLGRGVGRHRGNDAVHNFTYQRADWPRFVPVGINGVVETFIFYPFIHDGDL